MTDHDDSPTVSMANTKKELLEAYEDMKKKLLAKEKTVLDAEKARRQAEKQAAMVAADAQTAQDPLQRIHDLRSTIGRELSSLADRFEAEMTTYRKIQAAVEEKQSELQTIYGVETAAADLAALIEAQQARKEEFEADMERRRFTLEEEMKEIREKWNREKAQREQEVREAAETLKKQRQREKDEYEYSFTREKELRKNALEDRLAAMEKEIDQKRRDFEQEFEQRRVEFENREKAIAGQEAELAELRKEVDAFPERLRSEIQIAKEAVTERITSDFQKEKALVNSRFEGEKNVLSSKIEALEKLVKVQDVQIADLARRQELAYEKVQDIANRAVASAKREFISVPLQSHGSGQVEKGS